MDTTTASFADRRAAVAAAVTALEGLADALWECPGDGLGSLLGELDRLAVLTSAGRVAVTAEAFTRGEVAGSQCAGATAWVRMHAPSLAVEGAAVVGRCVEDLATPRLRPVRDAVVAGRVAPGVGLTVARELEVLRPQLADGADEAVTEALVTIGSSHGSRGVRDLHNAMLARYGLERAFEEREAAAKRAIALTHGRRGSAGLVTYEWTVDAEGAAIVEAAVGALSAPVPDPVTGARDPRSVERRRGEALLEVVRRPGASGSSTASTASVDSTAATASADSVTAGGPKATIIVTIDHQVLAGQVERHAALFRQGLPVRDVLVAGEVLGTPAAEVLLSPESVRRLACDATVLPVVLGTDGVVLDVGQQARLVTGVLRKVLWLRDRHCTFPGCSMPATWTDAHHLVHWAHGGATALVNLALLCGRHHTVVHRDGLFGTVTARGVVWDVNPGSFERALAQRCGDIGPPGNFAA